MDGLPIQKVCNKMENTKLPIGNMKANVEEQQTPSSLVKALKG